MAYTAKKIPVSCDEGTIRAWAGFMNDNLGEVRASLQSEGVAHEQWYLVRENNALSVIGVMDTENVEGAGKAAQASNLRVDKEHRAFKKHWINDRISDVDIDPSTIPSFPGYELLLDVKA